MSTCIFKHVGGLHFIVILYLIWNCQAHHYYLTVGCATVSLNLDHLNEALLLIIILASCLNTPSLCCNLQFSPACYGSIRPLNWTTVLVRRYRRGIDLLTKACVTLQHYVAVFPLVAWWYQTFLILTYYAADQTTGRQFSGKLAASQRKKTWAASLLLVSRWPCCPNLVLILISYLMLLCWSPFKSKCPLGRIEL